MQGLRSITTILRSFKYLFLLMTGTIFIIQRMSARVMNLSNRNLFHTLLLLRSSTTGRLYTLPVGGAIISLNSVGTKANIFPTIVISGQCKGDTHQKTLTTTPYHTLRRLTRIMNNLTFYSRRYGLTRYLASQRLRRLSKVGRVQIFRLVLIRKVSFIMPTSITRNQFQSIMRTISKLSHMNFHLRSIIYPNKTTKSNHNSNQTSFSLPSSSLSMLLRLSFMMSTPKITTFSMELRTLSDYMRIRTHSNRGRVRQLHTSFPLRGPLCRHIQ